MFVFEPRVMRHLNHARPIRLAMLIASAVLLALVAPAGAAEPVAPAAGSRFTTTDTVIFEAQPAPEERSYWFLFSTGADLANSPGIAFPADSDEQELDLGWLAAKFDHTGRYWWSLCPAPADQEELVVSECSVPWSFSVRFRLPDLAPAEARTDAEEVMSRKFRSYWRDGYNQRVACRGKTRTRQRCNVSVVVGDVIVSGEVTVYLKRHRSWALPYFRSNVRILDEYCYLVNRRPLGECQETRRQQGAVY
jgi:hypothetical protein